MASEKAKQLAAEQKAARKAEKLRKKNSDDPRDWGQFRQIIEAYRRTNEIDPNLKWWVWGSGFAAAVLVSLVGIWVPPWWMWLISGVMAALPVMMVMLTRRVKKANFTKYEGQPGSAEVSLALLDKKKWSYEIGIAATRQMDLLHRVIGQGGIILVGEGNPSRVRQLVASETRKHEQVAYGVKVSNVLIGKEAGQVPLDQLHKHIEKLPKVLQPHQITEVKQRLRALDAVRPKAPVPRGPMPTMKGVNRAMRGR